MITRPGSVTIENTEGATRAIITGFRFEDLDYAAFEIEALKWAYCELAKLIPQLQKAADEGDRARE